MTAHQLPGFSQQAHSHAKQGSAIVAWTDAMVRGIDTHAEGPVTLHFLQPGADRGTSIELTQPVLRDLRAVNGPPWAWPATTTRRRNAAQQPGTDPFDALQ